MPPKAEPKEKSEAEILREELQSLRGELSTVKTQLNEASTAKVQAELATMSEGERRLLAEETAADNAIASAENEADALTAQQASLWSEGKFQEASALSRKIAAAENRIQNEGMRKEYLSGQRETLKGQRTTHAAAPIRQVQTSGLDPRIQSWIDDHPKFKTWKNQDGSVGYADRAYYHRAMAGHNEAEANGVAPGTAEYFEIVELHTGDRQAETPYSQGGQGNDDLYAVERPQRPAAGQGSMAAAPSRGAPGSARPGRPPDLSAEEREVADGIMGHIGDPAERYSRYAAARDSRRNRGATH